MKMKKIIALLLSVANLGLGGVTCMNTAVVHAENTANEVTQTDKIVVEGIEKYLESFEEPDVIDYGITQKIQNGEDGWELEDISGNYNAQAWWFGDKDSIALRFAFPAFNLQEELSLDLKEAAVIKQMKNATEREAAEADIEEFLDGRTVLTATVSMDMDGSGASSFENDAEEHLRVLDADGNAFMEIRAHVLDKSTGDSELSLIALNEDKTENVSYQIAEGINEVFKVHREYKVYVDPETNSYRLDINGETFMDTPFGEWIPASTSSELGAAEQSENLKLGKISIGTGKSNWWGGVCIDSITLKSWDFASFSGESAAPAKPLTMWYRQPASAWRESSPLGNGRIGAMIWGGIFGDTVSLNDITCWSGEDDTGLDNPDGPEYLAELQKEFVKENPDRNKINELFAQFGGEQNETFGTHRPFGRLVFGFPEESGNITNYRRSLDLETAVSTVEYEIDGVKYKREAFVSEPDQVLVMNFSSDSKNAVTFDAALATEILSGGTGYTSYGDDGESLVYNGHTVTAGINSNGKGVSTYARLKANNTGGTVAYENGGVKVKDADEVTLIIALGTDYMNETGYKAKCDSEFENASGRNYAELKERHIADYSSMFGRLSIEIDGGDNSEPTDVRIEKVRNGGEVDGSFISLQYQFARYAMISASRESSPLPMPFVGMWDDNIACNMVWTNDYHMDLNIQMNQWLTNVTNISECEMPIINYFENLIIPKGKITAQTQYGTTRGWTTSGMSNAWGYTGNPATSPQWHGSTTNGPWMLQEVMNYFDHTWDKEFLRKRGFGMVKDTADFFLDYLKPYTYEGEEYLATIPGASPEHGTLEIMPAMDIAVISDIFTQVLRCYDILELDKDDYYNEVKDALSKLAPYRISPGGALAEWTFNDEANTSIGDSTYHRHTSHLLGLYPYSQITPDATPELAKAAYNSMKGRFDRDDYEHTEWTCINAQAFYARLKDGESAYKYLQKLGSTFIWPNFFSYSPGGVAAAPYDIFAIDATYGVAAATSEMLLQSHSDRLEFLPALPEQWESGRVSGMVGRGAFEVDIDWADYKLAAAKITSKAGNKCTIFKNGATEWSDAAVFKDENGTLTKVDVEETGDTISFDTNEGDVFVIKRSDKSELLTGHWINDNDPCITYNNFGVCSPRSGDGVSNSYMDDIHYTNYENSASAEVEFYGTGITVIGEKSNAGGKIKVLIDGESKGEIDSRADDRVNRCILGTVDNLDFGRHTLTLLRDDPSVCQEFDIDAFIIKGQYTTYVNDDDPRITYSGNWTDKENRNCRLGDSHFSDTAGDKISLNFTGTGVDVVAAGQQSGGKAEIHIDGEAMGTVDVNTGLGSTVIWSADELYNGAHTLEIVLTEGSMELDEFVLRSTGGVQFNPGTYSMTGSDGSKLLTESGAEVTEKELEGDFNQLWYIEKTGEGDYSRLINACTGKYLGVNSEGNAAQMEYSADMSQEWCITPSYRTPGRVVIENRKTGLFLQINMDSYSDGAWVSPYKYERADHFEWVLLDMGNGLSAIRHYGSQSLLEVDGNNLNDAGSRVVINSKRASNSQKWNIISLGNDTFKIESAADGRVIEAISGGVRMSDWTEGNTAAMWKLEKNTKSAAQSYHITNVKTGAKLMNENSIILTKAVASDAAKPVAREIKLNGKIKAGEEIAVSYTYTDSDNSREGVSEYKAYVADSKRSLTGQPFASGTDMKFTVPEDFDKGGIIAVEIIPKAENGKTGSSAFVYAADMETNDNFITTVLYSEDFSGEEIGDKISQQSDGWYHNDSGSDGSYHTVTTDEGYLKMTTQGTWYENAYFGKTFDADLNVGTKQYLGFDVMFFNGDNYDPTESKYYVSIIDSQNRKLGVMYLSKYTLDALAYNGSGCGRYNIASGMSNIYNNWYNVKLYIDTEKNSYAVSVNGVLLRNDDCGILFTPTDSKEFGSGNTVNAGGIKGIEFASERFSWNTGICLDNLEFGSYAEGAEMPWSVTKFSRTNNGAEFEIYENFEAANGNVYIASYSGETMHEVKLIKDIDFNDSGIYEDTVDIEIPENNGKLKMFMWNDGMQPIGNPAGYR